MNLNLSDIYGDVAHKVWAAGNTGIILSASNLPQPPEYLKTNNLVIRKGTHCYDNSYRVDAVVFLQITRIMHGKIRDNSRIITSEKTVVAQMENLIALIKP